MIKPHFNPFLRSEAHEAGEGGGASATATTAAAETGTTAAESTAGEPGAQAPARREPSRLELIAAAVKDKASILAENHDFRSRIEALTNDLTARETTIGELQATITDLQTLNTGLRADLAAVDAALKAATAAQTTVDAAAAKQVAGMGFESNNLPAAQKEGDSIEAMEARLGQETDPQKIVTLARQIDALKAQQAAG